MSKKKGANTKNTELRDELRDQIAKCFKQAIKKQDMTLKDVAEQTGMSYQYISDICRGASVPTVTTALNLSNCLGMTLNTVFCPNNACDETYVNVDTVYHALPLLGRDALRMVANYLLESHDIKAVPDTSEAGIAYKFRSLSAQAKVDVAMYIDYRMSIEAMN